MRIIISCPCDQGITPARVQSGTERPDPSGWTGLRESPRQYIFRDACRPSTMMVPPRGHHGAAKGLAWSRGCGSGSARPMQGMKHVHACYRDKGTMLGRETKNEALVSRTPPVGNDRCDCRKRRYQRARFGACKLVVILAGGRVPGSKHDPDHRYGKNRRRSFGNRLRLEPEKTGKEESETSPDFAGSPLATTGVANHVRIVVPSSSFRR